MLYRLDYIGHLGALSPVIDPILGRDLICRRLDMARQCALDACGARGNAEKRERVLVTRIDQHGRMRGMIVAHPDGIITRAKGEGYTDRAIPSHRDDMLRGAGFHIPTRDEALAAWMAA
jgi:hypothetical protein